jgi:hypothetical protein
VTDPLGEGIIGTPIDRHPNTRIMSVERELFVSEEIRSKG